MTTIPHPDPALQNIIQRITENLLIDQIYLHPYTIQGKQVNQLYVLLRNAAGQGIVSARALCNLAVAEKPQYRCYVSFPEDINRKIKQENMRATLICHPDKLVFEHPEIDTRIQLPRIDYNVWYGQAERYFEKELAKINAFEEGYAFYLNKANYGQAAFMLHQVIEQGYRAAENLVMGKEKISHSLRNHQEYIAPFCPELGVLFEKPHELSILVKLDESYSSARYDHNFSMSKEGLVTAANKEKELLAYLTAFNQDLLEEIRQRQQSGNECILHIIEEEGAKIKANGNESNEDDTAPPGEVAKLTSEHIEMPDDTSLSAGCHRQRVLSAINLYFSPTHVFCFAHQSWEERSENFVMLDNKETIYHRYYLAILIEEYPAQALYKQNQINGVLGDELEIAALYFKSETFNRKLDEGCGFFYFLANATERWLGKGSLNVKNLPEPVDLEKRAWQWKRYFLNAVGLIGMVQDRIGGRYDRCCSVVMSQAMEQLCLGLLYAFWGYRPDNILNLMYLIQLTESITPLARICFCLDLPEERKMVLALSKAPNEFRYHSNFDVDGFTLCVLRDRLITFSNKVEELVNHHFETLEVGMWKDQD